MASQRFELSKTDVNVWKKNLFKWAWPMVGLYLVTIIGVLSQDRHVFSFTDFIPTQMAQGGIMLYVLERIYDIGNKFAAEGK